MDEPIFQFAFEAGLFKFEQNKPQIAPLFELPPRIATSDKFIPKIFKRGKFPPLHPLLQRFVRNGRADIPARERSRVAQARAEQTTDSTAVRSTTTKSNHSSGVIKPHTVALIG